MAWTVFRRVESRSSPLFEFGDAVLADPEGFGHTQSE